MLEAMADDPQRGPTFDGPSMTYPQPWKSLPSPGPIAQQPPPQHQLPLPQVKRPLWMTLVLVGLVILVGVLTYLVIDQA